MPATAPRDSTLAVVGDGFGSLIVYATAIYLGYRPEEISIFGTNDNPVGTYQQFAHNLRQARQRAHLSQEPLGHRCGLHRTEISLL